MARIPIAAIAALLLLAGCGGSDSQSTSSVPGGADAGDVAVIKGWVDALRSGNPEAAANYFALPAVVQNGGPPVTLHRASDLLAFNQSLPCGAKLVSATTEGQVTTATFELTDRPNGDCGDGVGLQAQTAFVIEDGKIVHWTRVPGPDDGPQTPGTSTGRLT
jgi:major membrane immunogen (membrane-anchored lipoprotein)